MLSILPSLYQGFAVVYPPLSVPGSLMLSILPSCTRISNVVYPPHPVLGSPMLSILHSLYQDLYSCLSFPSLYYDLHCCLSSSTCIKISTNAILPSLNQVLPYCLSPFHVLVSPLLSILPFLYQDLYCLPFPFCKFRMLSILLYC